MEQVFVPQAAGPALPVEDARSEPCLQAETPLVSRVSRTQRPGGTAVAGDHHTSAAKAGDYIGRQLDPVHLTGGILEKVHLSGV